MNNYESILTGWGKISPEYEKQLQEYWKTPEGVARQLEEMFTEAEF